MCLEIYTNRKTKPKYKIAKEDINVFKVITREGFGRYCSLSIDGMIEPWERGYEYEETTPFRESLFYDFLPDQYMLEINGNSFHSKKTKLDAEKLLTYNCKVVKMIIPKGAKYYENDTDYASNRIIYP